MRIIPQKVKGLRSLYHGPSLCAEIEDNDGHTGRAKVDGSLILSGEVAVGDFRIELSNVSTVLFDAKEPQHPVLVTGERT